MSLKIKTTHLVFINPEITHMEGKTISEEGCLSVPNNYAKVERAEKVTVKALDKNGKEFSLDADGLLAICIQHELDHLKGQTIRRLLVTSETPANSHQARERSPSCGKNVRNKCDSTT